MKINTLNSCSRDSDDDKFINFTRTGGIEYMVSGDMDLLVLEEISEIKIVEVSEFLEIIEMKMY